MVETTALRYGWMTYPAPERSLDYLSAVTAAGAVITVTTMRMLVADVMMKNLMATVHAEVGTAASRGQTVRDTCSEASECFASTKHRYELIAHYVADGQ